MSTELKISPLQLSIALSHTPQRQRFILWMWRQDHLEANHRMEYAKHIVTKVPDEIAIPCKCPLPVYMALLSAWVVGQLCERSHDSNSIICIQKYELIVRSVGIPDSIHAIRFWPRRLCSGSSSCEGEVAAVSSEMEAPHYDTNQL